MNLPQAADLTRNSTASYRVTEDFFPALGYNFPPGTAVKIASSDQQVWFGKRTVTPTAAVRNDTLGIGIVSDDTTATVSYTNTLTRGTQAVRCTIYGLHSGALIDNSGANASVITNGTNLNSSENTAGRLEGVAAAVYGATMAMAVLPASGFGSSLGAGALAQSTGTITLTGTPATGNTIVTNIQIPYNQLAPGVAQYLSVPVTLTAAQAANVSAAATAVAAALNANGTFAMFYTATSAAGVVTIAVNGLSSPFAVTFATGGDTPTVSLSGTVGNGIAFNTTGTIGATVATTSGATLAGGTGYFGTAAVWVPFT